jgi:hypothetical protein
MDSANNPDAIFEDNAKVKLKEVENLLTTALLYCSKKHANTRAWRLFAIIQTRGLWRQSPYLSYKDYCKEVWNIGKTHAYDLAYAGIAVEFITARNPQPLDLQLLSNIKLASKLGRVPDALREKTWINYRDLDIAIPHYHTHISVNRCENLDEIIGKLLRIHRPEEIFSRILPSLQLGDVVTLMQVLADKVNDTENSIRSNLAEQQ